MELNLNYAARSIIEEGVNAIHKGVMTYFECIPNRMQYLHEEVEIIEESFAMELDNVSQNLIEQIDQEPSEIMHIKCHVKYLKEVLHRITAFVQAEILDFVKSMEKNKEYVTSFIERLKILDDSFAGRLAQLPDFTVKPLETVQPSIIGLVDANKKFRPSRESLFEQLYQVKRRDWFAYKHYTKIAQYWLADVEKIYMDKETPQCVREHLDNQAYELIDWPIKYCEQDLSFEMNRHY